VPLSMVAGDPIPDDRNLEGVKTPASVEAYTR
jgi:hypothetical protein